LLLYRKTIGLNLRFGWLNIENWVVDDLYRSDKTGKLRVSGSLDEHMGRNGEFKYEKGDAGEQYC
jgi:hypothetical protein